MIGVIDIGIGNLGSVIKALSFLEIRHKVVSSPEELGRCPKLLLPGVGAFGKAMEKINSMGLYEEIRNQALDNRKPFLGICLGMQLLFEKGYEFGEHDGLALVKGEIRPLEEISGTLPVPHIGWNELRYVNGDSLFVQPEGSDNCFYFVHSYYCKPAEENVTKAVCNYGADFTACIQRENIYGCQFHPEKSQQNGLNIFRKFAEL